MKWYNHAEEKKGIIIPKPHKQEPAQKGGFINSNRISAIPISLSDDDDDIKKLEAVKKDLLKLNLLSDSFIFKYEKQLNDIVKSSSYSSKDKAKMLMFISHRADVAEIRWWKRESSKVLSPKEEKLMTKEKLLEGVIAPEDLERDL